MAQHNTPHWNILAKKLICACVRPILSEEPYDNNEFIEHYYCDFCHKMHRLEFFPKLEDMEGPRCQCEVPRQYPWGFQCVVCNKIMHSDKYVNPL